jgi:hypothetical protein
MTLYMQKKIINICLCVKREWNNVVIWWSWLFFAGWKSIMWMGLQSERARTAPSTSTRIRVSNKQTHTHIWVLYFDMLCFVVIKCCAIVKRFHRDHKLLNVNYIEESLSFHRRCCSYSKKCRIFFLHVKAYWLKINSRKEYDDGMEEERKLRWLTTRTMKWEIKFVSEYSTCDI